MPWTRARRGRFGLRLRWALYSAYAGILALAFLCLIFVAAPQADVEIALGCLVGGGIALGLLIFVVFPYSWPIFVAGSVSGAIIAERWRKTWDTLLILPFERSDLLTVKAAAALRNLDALIPLWLWGQAIVAVAFVVGQAFRGVNQVMLILVLIEFGVARFQDYALAIIVGLTISLRAGRRESAAMLAVLAGLALVIVRLLLTLAFLAYLAPGAASDLPALILIVATGPSSAVALALPNVAGVLVLLLMIAVREVLIRRGFRYLVTNLGEAV